MDVVITILLAIMSYLYGSVPFALVVGKLFYNTDVRESGSGNLGGTNAGRVLGKKVGLIVILLDISKCCLSIFMTNIYAGIIAVVVFLLTLKISKYVSLSSVLASLAILFISPFIGYSTIGICTNALIVALLIFKHRTNIIRIFNDTESKITWM